MISRNGTQSSRAVLDRTPSAYDSVPVATASVVNKLGSASSSLYQNCRTVLERLYRVPGFAEAFIDPSFGGSDSTSTLLDGPDPSAAPGLVSSDPVSRCLHTLRLGSSLCFLFNALGLDSVLEVNPDATMTNLKACQKGTAYFIMACQRDLHWGDQDVFAIRELYGQDTNGVVKVRCRNRPPSFCPLISFPRSSTPSRSCSTDSKSKEFSTPRPRYPQISLRPVRAICVPKSSTKSSLESVNTYRISRYYRSVLRWD